MYGARCHRRRARLEAYTRDREGGAAADLVAALRHSHFRDVARARQFECGLLAIPALDISTPRLEEVQQLLLNMSAVGLFGAGLDAPSAWPTLNRFSICNSQNETIHAAVFHRGVLKSRRDSRLRASNQGRSMGRRSLWGVRSTAAAVNKCRKGSVRRGTCSATMQMRARLRWPATLTSSTCDMPASRHVRCSTWPLW